MKISKRQLNKIICEYLFSNSRSSQMLNEIASVSGDFAAVITKDIIKDPNTAKDFNDALAVIDDYVGNVTTSSFDQWLSKGAGNLTSIGFLSSESLAAAASAYGMGMAVLAAYSVVPGVIINTIKNLGTIEEKLKNLRKGYENKKRYEFDPTYKRIMDRGMDLKDVDFSDNAFKKLSSDLGVEQYGKREMIMHLAAELIQTDKDSTEVKMDQKGIAIRLLTDGVISNNFFNEVKKEYKRHKAAIENAPEKMYKEMLNYILKLAKDVKAGKSAFKQAEADFAKASFDLIFPGASNIAGMAFQSAADSIIS